MSGEFKKSIIRSRMKPNWINDFEDPEDYFVLDEDVYELIDEIYDEIYRINCLLEDIEGLKEINEVKWKLSVLLNKLN